MKSGASPYIFIIDSYQTSSNSVPVAFGGEKHPRLRQVGRHAFEEIARKVRRVAMFEDLLEDYKIVSNYREYVVGTGYYNGIKVTVCSTGIGGPSTEIAVLQLIALGAKALIRIGGTGGCGEPEPPDQSGRVTAIEVLARECMLEVGAHQSGRLQSE